FVESGVIPLWKWRNILCRITKRYLYQIIFLLSLVDFYIRCVRWFLVGMRWKADALSLFIICLAVVWADKRLILYFPKGEPGATMQAEVAPGVNFIADAP